MMDMDSLVQGIKDGLSICQDYLAFIFPESGYADYLIPRLTPRVRYNEVQTLFFIYFDVIKILIVVFFVRRRLEIEPPLFRI